MTDNICLPRYHFISVIIVFVIFTWYYHNITIKKIYNNDTPKKKVIFIDNADKIIRNYLKKRDKKAYNNDTYKKKVIVIDNTDKNIRNYLKKRDNQAYYNDMNNEYECIFEAAWHKYIYTHM